mgnify:CR=1 FL=1|tara:strand:- start:43 stop:672 length:630 start_codon:yes stop_codon:yes gene_type:complete
MATRKKQYRRKKSSRRSCKHGKLKRPVRTRKGGKRRCKRKSKRKSKRKFRMVPFGSVLERIQNIRAQVAALDYSSLGLFSLQGDYEKTAVVNELKRRLTNDQKNRNLRDHSFEGMNGIPGINVDDYVMINLLLDAGANINAQDESGSTALIMASMNAHPEIVKLLLQRGANVNQVNKFGLDNVLEDEFNILDKRKKERVRHLLINAGAK